MLKYRAPRTVWRIFEQSMTKGWLLQSQWHGESHMWGEKAAVFPYSQENKSQIPLLESRGNAVSRTQGSYLHYYPVVLNCRTTLVHSQKQCLICVIQTFEIWGFSYNFTYNFTCNYKSFLKKQIKSLDALHFYFSMQKLSSIPNLTHICRAELLGYGGCDDSVQRLGRFFAYYLSIWQGSKGKDP